MEIISNVESISKYPEFNNLKKRFTKTGEKIEVEYSIYYVV